MAKTPEQILQALAVPFDNSEIKTQQGFAYVTGTTVIRRLNHDAGTWDWKVTSSRFDGLERKDGPPIKMLIVEGELTIPGLGTRSGTGVQVLRPGSGEDMYKGASTDALKKASTLFGLGAHLYEGGLGHENVQYHQGGQYDDVPQGGYDPSYGAEEYDAGYQPHQQQNAPQRGAQRPQQGGAPQANPNKPMSEKQLNYIHSLADGAGVDDETLRMMIAKHNNGDTDIKGLNSLGASKLIEDLRKL